MASRGDIQAGRASIALALKDGAFTKGLRAASTKLKDFGGGAMKIGGAITAAGSVIAAGMLAAVNSFAETGSALKDMAGRTGMSASSLAELGHAASMTGASLDDVEIGTRKMQKAITSGSKAFDELGLSAANLQKLSPDEQFNAVSEALAGVADPTKKAALAMEVFGKSGTKLLPMVDDLKALRQEARDLNIVPDAEQVRLADAVGDAMDRVKKAVGGVVFQIGAALAPAVLAASDAITGIVVTVSKWVKDNKALVVTVAKIALVVMAAGAAITAIGAAIFGAGVVLSGIASGIAAVGTVLGVVFSPLGLLIAALAAAGVAWVKFTASGQAAANAVMGFVGPLLETFKQTFGGITDALMSGDLALAGQIGMAGLKLAFIQGMDAIAQSVGGSMGDLIGTLGTQILSGDLAGAWETVVSGLASVWHDFAAGIVDEWNSAVKAIVSGIFEFAKKFPKLGKMILGVDLGQQSDLLKKQLEGNAKRLTAEALKVEKTDPERAKELRAKAAAARQQAAGVTQNTLFDEAKLGATNDIDKKIAAAQQKASDAAAAFKQRTAGGAAGSSAAVDKAQAELDALTKQAAAERAKVEAKRKNQIESSAGAAAGAELPGATSRIAGAFTAAGAVAVGQGGSPELMTLKDIRNFARMQYEEAKRARAEAANRKLV